MPTPPPAPQQIALVIRANAVEVVLPRREPNHSDDTAREGFQGRHDKAGRGVALCRPPKNHPLRNAPREYEKKRAEERFLTRVILS